MRTGSAWLVCASVVLVVGAAPVPASAQTASASPAADVIAAAQAQLERVRRELSDPVRLRGVAQEELNLATARGLLATIRGPGADLVDVGVLLAKQGIAYQAQTIGVTLSVSVPRPVYASPSAAVLALAARHGMVLTAGQRAAVARLGQLAAPIREALLDVFTAFLAFEDATRSAYAGADQAKRDALLAQPRPEPGRRDMPPLPAGGVATPLDVGVDLGPVLAARMLLLDAARALRAAARQRFDADAAPALVDLCPAVAVGWTGDDTYPTDCALTVDLGGNDTYLNNAGGVRASPLDCVCIPTEDDGLIAAALVDLGGDDRYGKEYGSANGGGAGGAGFLFDGGGTDTYRGGDNGNNGGGDSLGTGFLLDAGEEADAYVAYGNGANGGAGLGAAGFLLDTGGSDIYYADGFGSNGGAWVGAAFLLDAGNGDDTYGNWHGPGVNGGASLNGAGFLLDAGGGDNYIDCYYSSYNSGWCGSGSNGGAGNDWVPDGTSPNVNTAGFLLDAGNGNDSYQAHDHGTNGGAAYGAVGLLLDEGGTDSYHAGATATNGGSYHGGIGLLLDGAGLGDTYEDRDGDGTGTDRTVAPKPADATGAQLDFALATFGAQLGHDVPSLTRTSLNRDR